MQVDNSNIVSNKKMPVIIKALINQAAFLVLHYAYDFFPTTFVSLFSGINESIFQHMKIGYFAYMLTHLVELFYKGKTTNQGNFLTARVFSTALLPWIMFLLYFLPEALFGKVKNVVVEIVLANIVLLVTSVLTILVERHTEQIAPSKSFIWVSAALYIVVGFLFIIYTFRLPWFDVFAIPPGWDESSKILR